MEYTVEKIEIKKVNVAGKSKSVADVELLDDKGILIKGVGIWEDFPDFEKITFGSKVVGTIYEKGQYKTLYPPKAPKESGNPTYKTKLMNDAMERKEKSIGQFQASKEESIKLMSAQRDSILLTIHSIEYPSMTDLERMDKIKKWMNWLLNNLPNQIEPF